MSDKIYVPSFEGWYRENSKGYRSRGEEPYTPERAREVYQNLLDNDFDFPAWNEFKRYA